MSRRLTKRDIKKLERDEYGATSPVYRYIRDSYAELVGLKVGRPGGPSWESFAQLLARRGQTNGKGGRLTADTARKLFRRVSLEVEARQAPKAGQPATAHRSRQRGDWSPPITGAKAPQPTPASAHRPIPEHYRREETPPSRPEPLPLPQPGTTGSSPLDDLPPEVRAKFDRLRQDFAETDRKRFGRF